RPPLYIISYSNLIDDLAIHQVLQRPAQVLGRDAKHRCAQAAGIVEGNDALVRIFLLQTIHQVNLRSDGERGSGWRLLHKFDEVVSRADSVSLLADLPAALWMNDDLDAGIVR